MALPDFEILAVMMSCGTLEIFKSGRAPIPSVSKNETGKSLTFFTVMARGMGGPSVERAKMKSVSSGDALLAIEALKVTVPERVPEVGFAAAVNGFIKANPIEVITAK